MLPLQNNLRKTDSIYLNWLSRLYMYTALGLEPVSPMQPTSDVNFDVCAMSILRILQTHAGHLRSMTSHLQISKMFILSKAHLTFLRFFWRVWI